MKRLAIFLFLIAFGFFLADANAIMQDGSKPRLATPATPQQKITNSIEVPKIYLNQNRLGKLVITDKDKAVYKVKLLSH